MPELHASDPDASPIRYLGAAHGWTGFLFAQMRWAEATDGAPPPVAARLAELQALAVPARRGLVWPREVGPPDDGSLASTWCNGAAGMVPLWTLAARLLAMFATWSSPSAPHGPHTTVTRRPAICAVGSPVGPTR